MNIIFYLIKQKKLKENLAVDKATISRSIRSLINKGYLKKKNSAADGRVNLIYLTDKAKNIKEEINDIYQQWFQKFTDEIDEKTAKTVLNTLKMMYEKVQDENK